MGIKVISLNNFTFGLLPMILYNKLHFDDIIRNMHYALVSMQYQVSCAGYQTLHHVGYVMRTMSWCVCSEDLSCMFGRLGKHLEIFVQTTQPSQSLPSFLLD